MYTVDRAEDYIDVDERLCSFIDDDDCRATFVYGYHNLTGKNFVNYFLKNFVKLTVIILQFDRSITSLGPKDQRMSRCCGHYGHCFGCHWSHRGHR